MVDTGLAATSLGVTRRKPEVRDTAALTEFGHLVETFTVNELIKQAGWAETNVELSHFRGPRMLRDKLGSEFVGEAVLNLGTHSYHYDERLYMMPLDRLWTPTATAADP